MICRLLGSGALLGCFVLAAGCATYTYDGRKYASADKALAAQEADIARAVSGVTPLAKPEGASVLVVLPTRARIETSAVVLTGNPQRRLVDFVVSTIDTNLLGSVAALRRRNLFERVDVTRRDDGGDGAATDAQYLLWFSIADKSSAAWYLRPRGSGERRLVVVDTGVPIGTPRLNSWLQGIQAAMAGQAPMAAAPATHDPPRADDPGGVAARLKKIEQLRDDGLISDAEYRKARARALEGL